MRTFEVNVRFVVEVEKELTQAAIEQQLRDLLDQAPEFFHPENVGIEEIEEV